MVWRSWPGVRGARDAGADTWTGGPGDRLAGANLGGRARGVEAVGGFAPETGRRCGARSHVLGERGRPGGACGMQDSAAPASRASTARAKAASFLIVWWLTPCVLPSRAAVGDGKIFGTRDFTQGRILGIFLGVVVGSFSRDRQRDLGANEVLLHKQRARLFWKAVGLFDAVADCGKHFAGSPFFALGLSAS